MVYIHPDTVSIDHVATHYKHFELVHSIYFDMFQMNMGDSINSVGSVYFPKTKVYITAFSCLG